MSKTFIMFTIPGEPCAKGRPRFVRATGKAVTPEKTARYEQLVQLTYMQQIGQTVMLDGPMKAEIRAYFSIPKSVSKKKHLQMLDHQLYPQKKPDTDNLAKIVLDALNGIAYHDDKDVIHLVVRKYWSDEPRVEVRLAEI